MNYAHKILVIGPEDILPLTRHWPERLALTSIAKREDVLPLLPMVIDIVLRHCATAIYVDGPQVIMLKQRLTYPSEHFA